MAQILQGAPVAAALTRQTAEKIAQLRKEGTIPTLAIVRIGENPDDIAYEKSATKRCQSNGAAVKNILLPVDATELQLMEQLTAISQDPLIHGCLLLKPLPKTMDEHKVCAALSPAKDIDGVTAGSLAAVFGAGGTGFPPCTAQACMEMLQHYEIPLTGKRVAVVGRSMVVGKPVAMLLLAQNATVTICHSKTGELPSAVRQADIVIAALGKARFLDAAYFRPGQIVLDVGVNFDANGKLCGDVDFAKAEPMVKAISPVPGGVGVVTNAVLLKQLIAAARQQRLE